MIMIGVRLQRIIQNKSISLVSKEALGTAGSLLEVTYLSMSSYIEHELNEKLLKNVR